MFLSRLWVAGYRGHPNSTRHFAPDAEFMKLISIALTHGVTMGYCEGMLVQTMTQRNRSSKRCQIIIIAFLLISFDQSTREGLRTMSIGDAPTPENKDITGASRVFIAVSGVGSPCCLL